MKLGIIIYSNDAETVWNAFRLANFSLKGGDTVNVFLLGKGVEAEKIDTDKFKVTTEMQSFVNHQGKIYACGTCLKIREQGTSAICPLSTMEDLHNIVKHNDKVLTF